MLKRLEVANFKSISQTSVDLSVENVIVGPNGVGKSTFLDVIHFLRDAANDGLDHAITKRHGIVSIRRWSKTRPFNIAIKASFERDGAFGDYRLTIASAGGDFSVIEEEANWTGPASFRAPPEEAEEIVTYSFKRNAKGGLEMTLPNSPFGSRLDMTVQESDLVITQCGRSSVTIMSLFFGSLFSEITDCGAYSFYPNKIREPQSLTNSEVLSDDGSNLASIIRQMRGGYRPNKDYLTSAIQHVLPIVRELQIKTAGGYYVPVFRVAESDDGHPHDLNLSQISDGTLRMLGMLTAFYQPKAPSRITLEEPEQMIHPGLLPILMDAARDYLDDEDDKQLIITTHSPSLLDQFSAENIISVSFEGGVSSFHPISERQRQLIKDDLFTAGELLVREGIIS